HLSFGRRLQNFVQSEI
ncbi:unnamed protein product, partial [Allacma fusca]